MMLFLSFGLLSDGAFCRGSHPGVQLPPKIGSLKCVQRKLDIVGNYIIN